MYIQRRRRRRTSGLSSCRSSFSCFVGLKQSIGDIVCHLVLQGLVEYSHVWDGLGAIVCLTQIDAAINNAEEKQ
ncbi:hypothetical protein BJY04DRAFT_182468 [Aspergillus karnatakaensis]|uniref:uncharacterized protein n=1 Tax=Aspergillus karnatakaensis TaxID=1810916 RepID=UPI003CCD1965